MLRHEIFYKQFSIIVIALAITMFSGKDSAFAVQEVKVGFIPGRVSDAALEQLAFEVAGIEYEMIGKDDYTLNRLMEFDVIGIGIVAYDSNADLMANFALIKEYVENGGYLVTLDFQQDSSWNQNYLPFPLTLLDPDLEDDVGVILADHEMFKIPNEITEANFGTGIWGAGNFSADGPQQISPPWEALVTDQQNNWPIVVGAPAGKGYIVFNSLQILQSVANLGNNEVIEVMQNFLFWRGPIGSHVKAHGPSPKDGVLLEGTWATLSWLPGDLAVSHDVYLGDNFDDVNDGLGDTFRGNQTDTLFVTGFPGYPYPDGLVPGTTYFWRIDEVNEAEPNSPWKGAVWNFTIPSKSAYNPVPADSAESVALDVTLTWTPGFDAKLHTVYVGEDFDTVNEATGGAPIGLTNYKPGPLKFAKVYYWRVDEYDGDATYKGNIWSFTTLGAVSGPYPADGAVDVDPSVILTWKAGAVAASHEVYFGMDPDTVANATKASPEYNGPKALGEESYVTGKLTFNTTYYWRIDEVNDIDPDSPWPGNVWSFTTGDFFVIDDFEDYDADENQIWYAWHDGLGYGSVGSANYFAGNGTGATVGDETTASYTEETIVHGGGKSMPVVYDNNKQGYSKYSQVEHTLTDQRDWTEQSVAELSLWFRGYPGSNGSFVETPVGTYTMTGSGTDIWNAADEFHYAFKTLTGVGTIQARVLSLDNTDPWAKAGVMIRETLEPGSKFAAVYISSENGCRFQARTDTDTDATSDTAVVTTEQTAIIAPYWVKLERDVAGNFRGYYSANGSTWTPMSWNPQNISMSSNVYVGLAVTSHDAAATCEAKFSNVTITGTVGQQWTSQDIGILSNDAEPMYVEVYNVAGPPAVVTYDDPAATQIDAWTEWIIFLQDIADQGIDLRNVTSIAIGIGTRGNMTVPGGSGKMFFDDVRLYRLGSQP